MRKCLMTILLAGVLAHSAECAWCSYTPAKKTYSCSYYVLDESAKTCSFIYTLGNDVGYEYPAVDPKPEGTFTFPTALGGYTPTRIGEYAFKNCVLMQGVILPDTIRYVDGHAFYGCEVLSTFPSLPNVVEIGEQAFYNCKKLTCVTLPEGLQTIRSKAFANCTSLTNVTLPSTLRSAQGKLFYKCPDNLRVHAASWENWMAIEETNYRSNGAILDYPDNVTLYLAGKPVTDLSDMPSTIRSIRENAFAGYGRLAIDRLPSSVTNVGTYAFACCPNITSFVFNDTETHFAPLAFSKSGIGTSTLPSWMTDVPEGLFAECYSMTNVTFHGAVKTLGNKAFYDCPNLKTVQLPESLTSIGESTFFNCYRMTAIDIPESVTNIGVSAFHGDWGLESLRLPSTLKEIPNYAFYGCSRLHEIAIPSTVTNLDTFCFAACHGLTNIVIPASVTRMSHTFDNCSRLTNVTMYGSQPYVPGTPVYEGTPENLLTTVIGYDKSWSNSLAQGTWKSRPIVCIDTWTVHFDLGTKGERTGGGALDQTAATYGSVTAPTVACTDEDYAFSGWSRSLSDIRFFTTIKAVYEPKPMAIKGSSSVSLMRFDDAAAVQLTALGGVKPYVWSAVSGLPDGLSISEEGVLSGNTAFLGTTTVNLKVTDQSNTSATLAYTLTLTENPDGKPVLDAYSPDADTLLTGSGGQLSFGVTAHDPEGQTLAYRWFVDGVAASGATGATFDYTYPDDGSASHAIRCIVEDAVWKGDYATGTTWTVKTLLPPVIFSDEGTFFKTGTGSVSITCNVAEAEIFYAFDEASLSAGASRYTAPFALSSSATVWALARYGDFATANVTSHFTVASSAFCNAADTRLLEHVTTAERYERFNAWAQDLATAKSLPVETILADANLWHAFAFGQSDLLTDELTGEDLAIRTFAPVAASGVPSFILTVSVGDLTVPAAANLEDLAEAVGVTGAAALDPAAFAAGNVAVTFSAPQDGRLKLTVGPKVSSDSFFLRLGLK